MKITTIKEVDDAMSAMASAMSGKGIVSPRPRLEYSYGGRCVLWMHFEGTVKGESCHSFYGEIDECFEKAMAFISELPSAEDAATHEYMAKIADAVDFAKDNGIDDEYVAPLRGVTCAMTDNLLTDRGKS